MKKMWNSPRFIFSALQACSIIAMLPALISVSLAAKGALHGQPGVVAVWVATSALWLTMWTSFLLMCGRLKREPSAFTERNARTLLIIAVCSGLLGLPSLWWVVTGLGGWAPGSVGSSAILQGFDMVVCFGVAAVALVLRRLLRSAMALQQDSDLTI